MSSTGRTKRRGPLLPGVQNIAASRASYTTGSHTKPATQVPLGVRMPTSNWGSRLQTPGTIQPDQALPTPAVSASRKGSTARLPTNSIDERVNKIHNAALVANIAPPTSHKPPTLIQYDAISGPPCLPDGALLQHRISVTTPISATEWRPSINGLLAPPKFETTPFHPLKLTDLLLRSIM